MNTAGVSPPSEVEELVGRIADEFTERLNRGEQPEIEEYAARHPEIAELLRQVLPALELIRLPGGADSGSGSLESGVLGDYRLLGELGRGGMGVVYKAEQISLGRTVALKVLPFAGALDARQLMRFQNEARAAACLHHPNIVPVFAIGCERAVHFYAMQYIEGESLEGLFQEMRESRKLAAPAKADDPDATSAEPRPDIGQSQRETLREPRGQASTLPSPKTKLAYFRRIAELGVEAARALDHAHEVGVVHRDIKPANLMLDLHGKLWITDFGLAQIRTDTRLTMTGDLVGTLRYMSPEQALAKRVIVDHRTDLYSLGATLYELLTLEPVFTGDDRQELLRQIAFEEPKPPRRHNNAISVELETIVLKALEKNPDDRYSTAKELADDLERFAKDEPIKARRPSLRRRVREWCRRNMVLTAVLSAVLFTAAVSGVLVLWRSEVHKAATEEAVRLDLVEAARLLEGNRFADAAQVLAAAKARLADTSGGAVRTHLANLRSALIWQDRLENARLQLLCIPGTQAALDYAASERAYGDAFEENGLNVNGLTAAQAAEVVKSSPIRGRLIRALDDWAYCRDHLADADASKLRQIAASADTSEWRRRLRDSTLSKNRAALEALAAENAVLAQPSEDLLHLVTLLTDANARRAGLRLLRRAQELYPGDFWTNYQLALSILQSPDQSPDVLAEATPYCRAALALQPRSAAVHLTLSWSLRRQGIERAREAEVACRTAISLQADNANAYCYLGICLGDQGRHSEAIEAFQESLKHGPPRAHYAAYHNLATDFWNRQRLTDEAVNAFRRAAEIAPEEPRVYSDLRNAYSQLGKASEAKQASRTAEAAYRKAIAHNANNYAAYVNLGLELAYQGRHAEAEEVYRKAIDLVPDRPEAHSAFGVLYYNQQKVVESEGLFRKACELGGDAEKHFLLAASLGRQEKLGESAAALRKAIELKPDYQQAIEALIDFKKDRDLVPCLRGLMKNTPQFTYFHASLALRCADLKDPDALDTYERAEFRSRALKYFQSTLAAQKAKLSKESGKTVYRVEFEMRRWLVELDFRHVRGEDALAKLPDAERSAWRKLWHDVDELRKQATPQGGFIQSWLVLSELLPYQGTRGDKALEQEQIPGEALLHPRAGERVEVQGKALVWREQHSSEVYIDFAPPGPPSEHKVAYAVCYVHADAERSDLKICIGSDDQAKLYLNGKTIHQVSALRPLMLDQDEIAPVSLRQGSNVLVFKVVNQTGPGPHGSVRFLTADGRIPEGIEYRLTP